jgi:hypothetical protein
VYTQKRDVTQRWKQLLSREGVRVEVLTTEVPPEAREAWYERQLRNGMQVCICNPALVQTGLDLLWANTLIFGQTGYSIYVLRQASRRSWRIGQTRPVVVKFLAYAGTMQERCLRLMGKKLLVSLALEGKFSTEGLQALEGDDDMLTAMARELVTQKGVGEKADLVWRQLQAERCRTLASHTSPCSSDEPVSNTLPPRETEVSLIEQPSTIVGLPEFGAATRHGARRTTLRPDENQLSLDF